MVAVAVAEGLRYTKDDRGRSYVRCLLAILEMLANLIKATPTILFYF